jgi:hypothetical protein
MASFDADQRRALADSVRAGELPACPECGVELDRRDVEPPSQVSYVRRRVWLFCPSCKRTAALDLRGGEPPSGHPARRS